MVKDIVEKKKLAGIGVGSGKKDSFFFCVLEHFPDENRWFLKTCQQLKEFQYPETEDSLLSWSRDFGITTVIVDFPLSMPSCYSCVLNCPGSFKCPVPEVVEARKSIRLLLKSDAALLDENPKKYEQDRVALESGQLEHPSPILTKSFKRKLKKGYVPYWNRSLDVDIWKLFYDDLLSFFNLSFDSFGNENFIQMLRFKYLGRHFDPDLKLFESNYHLCLLSLLNNKVIQKKNLLDLRNLETAVLGRIDILKQIEEKLNVFMYETDREVMIKNPRAFQSFILTLSGRCLLEENHDSFLNIEKNFFIPKF